MGWSSANDIVDPQIRYMVQAVENDEMPVTLAEKMLVELIQTCQQGDWDTEGESLELFTHVPWVVRAFAACDVKQSISDKADLKVLVRQVIDAGIDRWYDLSDDFWRNALADAIVDAVDPVVEEWA